jgi:hypothetical protein
MMYDEDDDEEDGGIESLKTTTHYFVACGRFFGDASQIRCYTCICFYPSPRIIIKNALLYRRCSDIENCRSPVLS